MTILRDAGEVRATSCQQLTAWQARNLPALEEVRPGVWAIPVPVPGNPIRFTYAYLALGRGGSVLLDPGADSEESWNTLLGAFVSIGFEPGELTGIVVSHFHFDHWEMADRLASVSGAWVALGRPEAAWVSALSAEAVADRAGHRRFLAWGAPPEEAEVLASTVDYGETLRYSPPQVLLSDGDTIPVPDEDLVVLITAGHSPGHVCLYDRNRGVFFTGDHLLPGITPHVALNPFGPADPLGEYLASLERLMPFGAAEALPAHEYRFTGVEARVRAIQRDVDARLQEVREVLRGEPGASVWKVAHRLTWSRPWEDFKPLARRMALDETAAHLAHLGAL